jgi:hypothetical protein
MNTAELVLINEILGYFTIMFQLQAFHVVNGEMCFILNCACFSCADHSGRAV